MADESLTEAEAKEAWKSAKTFEQLCELTAKFIEGTSPFSPEYGTCGIDEETEPLKTYLAALNRAGLMTTTSQPGFDSPEWKQRAFVDGFAQEATAKRIARISLYTDLHIVTAPVGVAIGFRTPIIVRDFQPHGWGGGSSGCEAEFYKDFPNGLKILREAWYVDVIDLVWGRQDHLWENLMRELCYSEAPHPDLAIGGDFIY